ncbi:hypothetical protein [Burkholderia gladioli]|uniref:hypothetical protein n=1 Tax=Burkholderia gladioli TaxID=28095 RepID=UPI001FC83902|nr:hypothetical protein [Burkholderia gladioli]
MDAQSELLSPAEPCRTRLPGVTKVQIRRAGDMQVSATIAIVRASTSNGNPAMPHPLISDQDTEHSRELANLLNHPAFAPDRDEPDRHAMQARIYEQLRLLNQYSGGGAALLADRRRLIDTLAFAATVSPPLFNVAQAHYGVCLFTLKTLGKPSAALDRIIAQVDRLDSVASILITEVGVACSHLSVATRAEYDPATDSFVLVTPEDGACKMMANVALDGVAKTGVVFARLWCGGQGYGLFPFAVPIRDRTRVFDGIRVKALPGDSSMGLDYTAWCRSTGYACRARIGCRTARISTPTGDSTIRSTSISAWCARWGSASTRTRPPRRVSAPRHAPASGPTCDTRGSAGAGRAWAAIAWCWHSAISRACCSAPWPRPS